MTEPQLWFTSVTYRGPRGPAPIATRFSICAVMMMMMTWCWCCCLNFMIDFAINRHMCIMQYCMNSDYGNCHKQTLNCHKQILNIKLMPPQVCQRLPGRRFLWPNSSKCCYLVPLSISIRDIFRHCISIQNPAFKARRDTEIVLQYTSAA